MDNLGTAYRCESCSQISYGYYSRPWNCPICGEETCENCFSMYMLCSACAEGYTDEENRARAKEKGFEWED